MASTWSSWALVIIIGVHTILASTVYQRDTGLVELDPIQEALHNEVAYVAEAASPQDRDKRLAVIKSVGIKAILLNLVFGKIDGFLDYKTRLINQLDKQNVIKNEKYFGITTPKPTYNAGRPAAAGGGGGSAAVSTPAPIEFSTNSPVSLVIPDRLYGNSFGLVTNVSQLIGDVLFNTADRAQELSDRLGEKIRRKFGFATNLFGSSSKKRSTPTSQDSGSTDELNGLR